MGSGKSGYSQKKWIRTSWFADARPVNKDWKREDERGSKKGSKCNFCHQATMGLDGLSAAIIPTAKSDPFSNSNSPFFADKENMGSREMGVPYCRLERQMVTEKRSQIQSVSRWILMNWKRLDCKSQVWFSLRTFCHWVKILKHRISNSNDPRSKVLVIAIVILIFIP